MKETTRFVIIKVFDFVRKKIIIESYLIRNDSFDQKLEKILMYQSDIHASFFFVVIHHAYFELHMGMETLLHIDSFVVLIISNVPSFILF